MIDYPKSEDLTELFRLHKNIVRKYSACVQQLDEWLKNIGSRTNPVFLSELAISIRHNIKNGYLIRSSSLLD